MSKPLVAVFTAWPELITDKYEHFEVVFKENCQSLVQNTFASTNIKENLQRYVAWAHDRRWYHTFDYCLYVNAPLQIELSDFLLHLESDYTTYTDTDKNVIFYRPGNSWQLKIIDIEKSPSTVGIVFIDCWQKIADKSIWVNQPADYNFYSSMKNELSKYQTTSLIFHTSSSEFLQLAKDLRPWATLPNSGNIMNIEIFKQHYQDKKIYDWIVVGAHWQGCMHGNALGFDNLYKLKIQDPKLRIYSHQNCTVKFINNDTDCPIVSTLDAQDYLMDRLTWEPNGNLYELKVQ